MNGEAPVAIPTTFENTKFPSVAEKIKNLVTSSVAVTRAGVFANLWNKIGKILKIFERLDYLRSRWVLCQL
jgi:hypothetical protein